MPITSALASYLQRNKSVVLFLGLSAVVLGISKSIQHTYGIWFPGPNVIDLDYAISAAAVMAGGFLLAIRYHRLNPRYLPAVVPIIFLAIGIEKLVTDIQDPYDDGFSLIVIAASLSLIFFIIRRSRK